MELTVSICLFSTLKKEQREHELEKLETIIDDKKLEHDLLNKRISNYNEALDKLTELEDALQNDEKYQLPEPQGFMTAKAIRLSLPSR